MQRLNDTQYNKRKRQELRKRKRKGDLDDNEVPYLEWLNGDRDTPTKDYSFHRKANKIITGLMGDYTCKEISIILGRTSESVIQRLYSGEYDQVSEGYASAVYYKLKSAQNSGEL